MRPSGNENKGAMKLRVDFKPKQTGDLFLLFGNYSFIWCVDVDKHAYHFNVNELDILKVINHLVIEKKVKGRIY